VQKLRETLQNKLENAKRVAVLGIGSQLRGDDAAGVLVAQQIEKIIVGKKTTSEVRIFIGDTAPENLTGEIKRFQPTHLIIIDSADFDAKPGDIQLINSKDIGGTSFCTHMLPTVVLTDYLLQSFKFDMITIGIQPRSLGFGAKPSKEAVAATKKISSTLGKLFIKS
jgi:hydrogenase 3 maturation protease